MKKKVEVETFGVENWRIFRQKRLLIQEKCEKRITCVEGTEMKIVVVIRRSMCNGDNTCC